MTWTKKTEFPHSETIKPNKDSIGKEHTKFRICTFTEFDPLRCTMMGYIDKSAVFTPDIMLAESTC